MRRCIRQLLPQLAGTLEWLLVRVTELGAPVAQRELATVGIDRSVDRMQVDAQAVERPTDAAACCQHRPRRAMRRLQNPTLFRPTFSRAGWRIVRFMGVYPPPLTNQQYERTGRYGREWDVSVVVGRGRITVTARNKRPGGEYVGSEQMQAGIHRCRWRTDEQALDHVRPSLLDDLRDVIERG